MNSFKQLWNYMTEPDENSKSPQTSERQNFEKNIDSDSNLELVLEEISEPRFPPITIIISEPNLEHDTEIDTEHTSEHSPKIDKDRNEDFVLRDFEEPLIFTNFIEHDDSESEPESSKRETENISELFPNLREMFDFGEPLSDISDCSSIFNLSSGSESSKSKSPEPVAPSEQNQEEPEKESTEIERILAELAPENIVAAKLFVRMEESSHEKFLEVHELQDKVTVEELKAALAQYSGDGEFVGEAQEEQEEQIFELKRINRDDPDFEEYEFEDEEEEEDPEEPEEHTLQDIQEMFSDIDAHRLQKFGDELQRVSKMSGLAVYLSLIGVQIPENADKLTFQHYEKIHEVLKRSRTLLH